MKHPAESAARVVGEVAGRLRFESDAEYSRFVRQAWRLRIARRDVANLSQAAMAKLLSKSPALVSAWELGTSHPGDELLALAAPVLGVDLAELKPPAESTASFPRGARSEPEDRLLDAAARCAFAAARAAGTRPPPAELVLRSVLGDAVWAERTRTVAAVSTAAPAVTGGSAVCEAIQRDTVRYRALVADGQARIRQHVPLTPEDARALLNAFPPNPRGTADAAVRAPTNLLTILSEGALGRTQVLPARRWLSLVLRGYSTWGMCCVADALEEALEGPEIVTRVPLILARLGQPLDE
jgi:transcriptional regulator with XRE-family HTH domain